jgi:hypothetical protein
MSISYTSWLLKIAGIISLSEAPMTPLSKIKVGEILNISHSILAQVLMIALCVAIHNIDKKLFLYFSRYENNQLLEIITSKKEYPYLLTIFQLPRPRRITIFSIE